VQIMGYELAPDNALFSDAKDSGLSAADLEIAKPQEADFDLGASEDDDTNFSSADFNLGEEDTDGDFIEDSTLGEAGDLESTQQVLAATDKSPTFDDDADDLLELPDDLGDELEFSMDDEPVGDDTEFPGDLELPGELSIPGDEAGELDMLDDLDLDAFNEDVAEQPDDDADTKLDLGIDDEDLELEDEVQERAADDLDTALDLGMGDDDDLAGGDFDEDDIDLGMDDMAFTDAIEPDTVREPLGQRTDDTASTDAIEPIEEAAGLELDIGDKDEDISIIDFGGDDFVEPTEMMPSISSADIDDNDDDFVLDDDVAEDARTGTFAPGDFEEPAALVDSLDDLGDMDDLMLPDDVDEVSTKLDLARAFIDMGDTEGARGSLEEVKSEGNAEQKAEAKTLLDQI
jgi:pilus assembly protein FimV